MSLHPGVVAMVLYKKTGPYTRSTACDTNHAVLALIASNLTITFFLLCRMSKLDVLKTVVDVAVREFHT